MALGVAAWAGVAAYRSPFGVDPGGPAAVPVAGPERFRPVDPPREVPPFAFVDAQGRKTELGDFRGRVVLLNLWATWCGPCVKEMPSLDRLQAKLGGPGFEVVALSVDRGGRETVEPFLKKLGVGNLALYLDPANASMRALAPRGLPTTLLIGWDGREMARLEGAAEWDSPEMVALLRKVIGPTGSAPGGRGAPAGEPGLRGTSG